MKDKDRDKTKEQLVNELAEIRKCLVELEKSEADDKQQRKVLQISNHFLRIANRHSKMLPLLNEFVAEIRKYTNCAAVGLRMLDEEGNIPYQAYHGFSQSFYESESPLSIHSDQCMCINVIKGLTDPRHSFYTKGGSFYMNGTTRFLATVSEQDKGKTRNVCNLVGYETVVLVPIRVGKSILGLIHVADPQENKLPLTMVEMLEGLAMHLGNAIQRVWAEEALITERDKAKNYLDIAGVIIVVIDSHQKVSLINKKGCEILGYDENEIIGKNWFDTFIPKRNRDEVKEAFKKLKAGEIVPVEYFENPVLTKNNDERVIAWHNTLLRDEDSKIIATLSSGEDITERKKAEEEILKLNKKLTQSVIELTTANQDLDAFNHTISHDLKVPLVIIGGFINRFLKKQGNILDIKEKDMFHAIQKHTQEMERLIKDLLVFSRAGRQKIKPTEIDTGNLVTTVLNELKPLSEGRIIKYDIKTLPAAYGDKTLIKQVFINLLTNAIKFTTNKKRAIIEVEGWTEGNENVYYVKDNGMGFNPQDSDKLFTVFQRLHGIEELEGSGVGLSIVQRIVKRHGGRVWAEGKVNEGASFYFSLPNKIPEDS